MQDDNQTTPDLNSATDTNLTNNPAVETPSAQAGEPNIQPPSPGHDPVAANPTLSQDPHHSPDLGDTPEPQPPVSQPANLAADLSTGNVEPMPQPQSASENSPMPAQPAPSPAETQTGQPSPGVVTPQAPPAPPSKPGSKKMLAIASSILAVILAAAVYILVAA